MRRALRGIDVLFHVAGFVASSPVQRVWELNAEGPVVSAGDWPPNRRRRLGGRRRRSGLAERVDFRQPSPRAQLGRDRSCLVERAGVVTPAGALEQRTGEERPRADAAQDVDRVLLVCGGGREVAGAVRPLGIEPSRACSHQR